MMEKSPFLAIFLARLIPVFPQAIVNIYPAFLNIRLLTYTVASALGKIPAMLVYSFLGKNLFSNWQNSLIIIGIYMLFLFIVYLIYRLWLKNKLI
ncbi:SNARE associated Golgi protein [compost metagenome]